MPKFILVLFIFVIIFNSPLSLAQDDSGLSEVSLAYGYSRYFDQEKNNASMLPTGPAYKLGLGARRSIIDLKLMFRYASLDHDFTYQSIQGQLKHQEFTLGTELGLWVLPFLRPKIGYAGTGMRENVSGSFSTTQLDQIKQTYNTDPSGGRGIYYGGEMAFLRVGTVQLYADYTYYHFNTVNTHSWEAMIGLRMYTHSKIFKNGSGSNPAKSNDFFEAIYKIIFGGK